MHMKLKLVYLGYSYPTLMDAESWFNAKKALELGFVDSICMSLHLMKRERLKVWIV